MFNGNCEVVAYDQSYYNLSVRPFEEDAGLSTHDPFGNPGALIDILTTPPGQIPSAELLSQPMLNIANPAIAIGERTSVAFLKGLTDQRVVYRKAPFDAPQLFVPNGHRMVHGVPAVDSDGTAADIMLEVPAVGRNGGAPLKGFLNK